MNHLSQQADTLTPAQVGQLRACWELLEPQRERLGALFYERLFELDPSLRAMFPPDMQAQSAKLVATLNVVVTLADDLAPLLPTVRELGQRHREWRVTDAHYALVGAALEWSFGRVLGAELTPEEADAWRAAYDVVARAMKEPATRPVAPA